MSFELRTAFNPKINSILKTQNLRLLYCLEDDPAAQTRQKGFTHRVRHIENPTVDGRAKKAEDLFKAAAGGATLHQLRHSALTHDAEDGASTPMLMAKSGHTSVASLARYARPSAEALARWQAQRDPARRR